MPMGIATGTDPITEFDYIVALSLCIGFIPSIYFYEMIHMNVYMCNKGGQYTSDDSVCCMFSVVHTNSNEGDSTDPLKLCNYACK